jgi:hypothetical protein
VCFGDSLMFWRGVLACLLPISASFLLGIHFEPEDGGCRFFQIIGLSLNYTVLLPR